MTALIIASASANTGGGHLARSLVLARELNDYGFSTVFATDCISLDFEKLLIENEKICFGVLRKLSFSDLINKVARNENGFIFECVIVDSYELTSEQELLLSQNIRTTVVFSDYPTRRHYCNILIDQNIGRSVADYTELLAAKTILLSGTSFAMIRREFRKMRSEVEKRRGLLFRRKTALVCFGAGNCSGLTKRAFEILTSVVDRRSLKLEVVIGPGNPTKSSELITRSPSIPVRVWDSCDSLQDLMFKSDFAIGSGGGMCWERCFMGLPSILVSIARNQDNNVNMLTKAKVAISVPTEPIRFEESLAKAVTMLTFDSTLRSMSKSAFNLVDGLGASRVAKTIFKDGVRLREGVLSDCDFIFNLRKLYQDRNVFRAKSNQSLSDHQRWYKDAIVSRSKYIGIIEDADIKVGYLRFDIDKMVGTISILLAPEARGKNIGKFAFAELLLVAFQHPIQKLRAEIYFENLASKSFFESVGFNFVRKEECFFIYERKLQ